ncbi:MAG: replicative DNA helicase, partial [Lachnospiraceae bacterium]|nr:replicative DNA helicase [Lachnospiraceae bacterium]
IAEEFDASVFVLSKVSRRAEMRKDCRPIISDLADAGIDEEVSDVIIVLYRENFYKYKAGEPGIAEVIIRKNNMGATGTIKLEFIPKKMLFRQEDKA